MTALPITSLASEPKWVLVADFFVRGIPGPAGSKTFMPFRKNGYPIIKKVGKTYMVVGNYVDAGGDKTKEWRKRVKHSAAVAMQGREPIARTLKLSVLFYFERPRNHYRTGKYAGLLRDDAPPDYSVDKDPDVSKLLRGTEDSMSGVVYRDDCYIGEHGRMFKRWGKVSGAQITVWAVEEKQLSIFGENQ